MKILITVIPDYLGKFITKVLGFKQLHKIHVYVLVILSLLSKLHFIYVQSNLGYPNADYPKLLGYSKTMDSPDFFLYYLLQ